MLSKFKLRKQYRDLRSQIKPAVRHDAALAAANILLTLPIFKSSERIACYLAAKDEFDASPIIETIWNAKKTCYLPILEQRDKEQNYLRFIRYQYGDPLHMNRYSILEPVKLNHEIQPIELDMVIMPLVAFDLRGNRLGTGGGYYDRTFAVLRDTTNGKKPLMIGLGYAVQQTESVIADPWDVRMDGVITEKEFISCN
jgi:5-formyltetrahydrofolate cyclo-ligase